MDTGVRSPVGVILAALLGTLLGGCAMNAEPVNPALADARSAYQRAAADATVTEHGGAALEEARQALERAAGAAEQGADDQRVSHLAYLAEQRVAIAEQRARRAAAQARIDALGEERAQLTAQLRGAESEQYREQAMAAQARVRDLETELAALEVQSQRTERGLVLTLEDVIFELDSARLKPGAQQKLDPIVSFLKQNPERQAVIEGHTDGLGTPDYNQRLSRERAEAVREYIADQGVSTDRIFARGYGEQYPVANNATEAGRQHNRRVEIVIAPEGVPADQRVR